ncbi:hypothetical protein BASA81_017845 [Batrachochytrium salamandrivorans]|nr:hypothetical protein BASA81_017845 [Batrachochytrium salamandrivorans]
MSDPVAGVVVARRADENKQEQHVDVNEHLLSLEEVEQKYTVSVDAVKPTVSKGLSPEEATKRLEQYGP